ncbi:MAG: GAF domain-containing protein [Chloroflexi bacterium]|nr:GAF domain-containing protein [Chloroflexota bacterium]
MKQKIFAVVVWITYLLVFIPLYNLIGAMTVALAVLPVSMMGLFFGGRAGLLSGLLVFPLNISLVALVGWADWNILSQGVPGAILIVLIGTGVGQLCDLGKRQVTARHRAEEALLQRNSALAMLNRASQTLNATLDLDQVLAIILEQVRHLMNVVACSVWLTDPNTKELVCRQAAGPQSEIVRGWRLAPGEGIAGWVAHHGKSLIVGNTQEDIRHSRNVDQETGLMTRSILSVPLKIKQNAIGVLQVTDKTINRFDTTDLELLEPLSASAAIAIENARLVDKLQQRTFELETRNEELGRFTYVASHNLRTPLVNLQGFSAELRLTFGQVISMLNTAFPHLNETQRQTITIFQADIPEALDFIDSSVSHLNHLTNALSELSRLGHRELELEPVNMESLVQKTLQVLSLQIAEHRIKVTTNSLPKVVADRTSMKQIIDNLLTNAVLYLVPDRPGEIEITAESNHDGTTFRIRDNGRGIAKDDMYKVFAPFRRVGKLNVPGKGMGLAYVQTLIRRHSGRIWCESELGIGTTFIFTIPNYPLEMKGNHNV